MSFRIDQLAVLNLATVGNSITAGSFVRSGGTSSQFLKADGTVDTNAYITGITSGMVTTALGYTPVPTTRTLTINGVAQDLSADRSWTISAGVSSVTGSGSGISVSPTTGAVVVSNTGVTSNVAGTGISVSGATGAVTITNTGVTSIVAGTAITISGATGAVTINNAGVTSLNGSTGALTGFATQAWVTSQGYLTANQTITLSGEASGSGSTSISVTLGNSAVIGKVLTGLSITGSTITSTDSILTAFGKLQNQVNGLIGGVIYQGTWNASTNSPTLTSSVGTKGYYYVVSVAGSTNLNGVTDWKIGDWAIYNGSAWEKVDNTDAVSSVNGQTGAVVLSTTNIAEGTNLYYTDARARLALSFVAGSGAYNSSTGVITIPTNTNQLTNGAGFITGNQTITLSGDASGSGTTSITVTLANSGVVAGAYNNVTVNAKGLVTSASNVSYLTGNQTITLSGDATGSGATSIAVTLANSGVSAGTYGGNNSIPSLTIDAKGRVTSATTVTPSGTWGISVTGTAGSETLATVTGRGATTSTALTFNGGITIAGQGTGTGIIGNAGFTSNYTGISLNGTLSTSNYNILSSPTEQTLYINRPTGVAIRFREANGADQMVIATGGAVTFSSTITASSLIRSGGTSSQFLKADGSVDSNSYITSASVGNGTLTLAVSGSGLSGSASFTANQSGNTTFTVTSNATNANTASTIVFRDASGNFSAGTITASLSGNATTASTWQTARTLTIGSTGKSVNGSADVSWSLAEIGAPSTTGTGASGTWSINITGSAGSATNSTNTENVASGNISNLNTAWTLPGSSIGNGFRVYRYNAGATGEPVTYDNANWLINIYSHPSGGTASYGHQIAAPDTENIYFRLVTNGTFYSWRALLHSGNYNSYAPTLTGGGASGNWGINITGNADTVDNFHASQSTVANNIVVRDGNGYIFGNYINMTDDGNPGGGTSISSFITKQGDNYYRSVSPTNAMASIRGVASGTWGINISGNSATTSQTNFTTLTLNSATVATQSWVTSQGYVTGGPFLPLSGGTISGNLNVWSGILSLHRINFTDTSGSQASDPYSVRWISESSARGAGLSWLEFQLNDDSNEEIRIYGNSCAGYGCGAISDNLYHRFRADGYAWHAGTAEAGADFRAPIFYDSTTTSYYLDIASTSRLGGGGDGDVIQMLNASYNAWLMIGGWTTDTTHARLRVSNGNIHMDSRGGGYDIYLNWYTNRPVYFGGNQQVGGTIYDYTNNAYYLKPSSFSYFNQLGIADWQYIGGQTSNGQSNYQWEGATYRNPGDWTARLIVRRDNASTGINGAMPSLVLFNNNGSDQTTVSMVFATNECSSGSNSVNLAGIIAKKEASGTCGGWSPGSLTFFVKDYGTRRDALYLDTSGYVSTPYSFRAPIFYDSDNTAYYGNFASTSVMNSITFGTSTTGATLSGNSDWGVRFSNSTGYIQLGPANGSYAHIYTDRGSFYFNVNDLYANGNLVLTAANYTNYTLPIGGGWYGVNMPGSRWGGYAVSGGEIVFGNGLPNAGQMGMLIDGAYVAGENNGFWSLPSNNDWNGRRGMYWDGSYLNFTANSPTSVFTTLRLANGFELQQGGSNYGQFNSWVHLPGFHGLYSGQNSAHIYPNNGTYGSWMMSGSRNGWQGIEFNSGSAGNVTMMVNTDSNTSGFHNNSYGWQIRWYNGTLYCGKNSYGGNDATVLDSTNAPYAWNMNQYVRTSDAPTFNGVYTNDWFRANGCTGFYFQSYATGLRASACEGASYGNACTYGNGPNGYNGWMVKDPGNWIQGYMWSSSGNGGSYGQTRGDWHWYWSQGNSCMGISSSTTSSSYALYVNNKGIYTVGDVVAYSDRRKKTDIVTIDNALEKVTNLRGVFYTKIGEEEKGRKTGVIAQEINEVLPEVVTYAADVDEYGVAYGNIVGVLIEAIKEQQKQINELKSKLN